MKLASTKYLSIFRRRPITKWEVGHRILEENWLQIWDKKSQREGVGRRERGGERDKSGAAN